MSHFSSSFSHSSIRNAGVSFIELLIGLLITSFILVGLAYITSSTGRNTTRLAANAELTREAQIAQQIIAGRISEAIYIWAPGSTVSMTLGGGVTTRYTIGGGAHKNSWDIHDNSYFVSAGSLEPRPMQFLAMILPPIDPKYDTTGRINNCRDTDALITNSNTTDTNATTTTDGCYRFFAYYPIRRSFLVGADIRQLAVHNKPAVDPSNHFPHDATKDPWVLMEYRANLFKRGENPPAWDPEYATGNRTAGVKYTAIALNKLQPYFLGKSANILLDYIKPNSLSFKIARPGSPNAQGLSDPTIQNPSTGESQLNTNNGSVTFEFELERYLGSSNKATINKITSTVTSKNWYCPRPLRRTPFDLKCP